MISIVSPDDVPFGNFYRRAIDASLASNLYRSFSHSVAQSSRNCDRLVSSCRAANFACLSSSRSFTYRRSVAERSAWPSRGAVGAAPDWATFLALFAALAFAFLVAFPIAMILLRMLLYVLVLVLSTRGTAWLLSAES